MSIRDEEHKVYEELCNVVRTAMYSGVDPTRIRILLALAWKDIHEEEARRGYNHITGGNVYP